ncbi:MAG: hypothetical protein WCG25_09555 [bacterium]
MDDKNKISSRYGIFLSQKSLYFVGNLFLLILFLYSIEFILHVHIFIPNPNHQAAKFALFFDLLVGTLIIAATGTRLKTIILISANPYSQNSLNPSHATSFSSTIILSLHRVIEYLPSSISIRYLLSCISVITSFHI